MRRLMLCALISIFISGAVLAQQPAHGADPAAGDLPPLPPLAPLAPPVQDDEIRQLKEAIADLQKQVKKLSAPADGRDGREPPKLPGNSSALTDQIPKDPFPAPQPGVLMFDLGSDSSLKMSAEWKYGLEISTADDAFRVHVGGTTQFDYGWNAAGQAVQFGPGGTGEFQDGAVFRRARITIDGTMYQHFEWVAEFDFANNVDNDNGSTSTPIGSPSFTNVWVGVNDLPWIGTMRVGWMKEPIGFEHMTNIRWRNFMESAPGGDSLSLTSPGVLILNATENQRVTWAAGFFHIQNDNFGFGFGDGEYAETGRVTFLPWYEDEGAELLHLGIGASHRALDNNQIDIKARPSVRTMPGTDEPRLAETGTILGSRQEVFDVEVAGVYGPWTLQSEYYWASIQDAFFPDSPPPHGMPLGTLFYQGAYIELLYFLTGEHQPYDRKDAVFDRVIPLRNFNIWNGSGGLGAWQVGFRYGFLDLQDKGVNGATLHDMVLGLNWFLNPNMKIQWNFAADHRDSTPPGSSGWTYIFGSRLAVDF
jgi:phosphate-selective porin OprO and OprP